MHLPTLTLSSTLAAPNPLPGEGGSAQPGFIFFSTTPDCSRDNSLSYPQADTYPIDSRCRKIKLYKNNIGINFGSMDTPVGAVTFYTDKECEHVAKVGETKRPSEGWEAVEDGCLHPEGGEKWRSFRTTA